MYKILVVDDSALMRKVICDIIEADGDFHVVDVSADGEDAYNKIKNNSYDIVVLDMVLPKLTALQMLQKLYDEHVPFNVILISSSLKEDCDSTIRAIELGALDFVVKPIRSTPETKDEFSKKLLASMHTAAKTTIARRNSTSSFSKASEAVSNLKDKLAARTTQQATPTQKEAPKPVTPPPKPQAQEPAKPIAPMKPVKGKKIIALACSTGGPQALHTFVPMLPSTLPVPLVLVQHMPEGFTASLAARLDQISSIHVKEAEDGEFFKPGWVYVTPGGKHMEICENASHDAYCHLNDDPPVNSLKPCADVMYKSLVKTSFDQIICVVLTGMGADGTAGIQTLSQSKNTYVISQEASTCVVYGMPKSVEQRGLSNEVVPLNLVADSIVKKLGGL